MTVEIKDHFSEKFKVVRISSVGETFSKWMNGQTCPMMPEEENPFDWAYIWDYDRYIKGLPIID